MILLEHKEMEHTEPGTPAGAVRNRQADKLARVRLAGELFSGRYRIGKSMKLSEFAARYNLDQDSVLKVLRDFQTLGMVTIAGNGSAVFRSPNPKEMQEAYEIRAALEEIAGRSAARELKGNTAGLQHELDAMRAALRRLDLDSFAEHDVAFHRTILQASQNEVLLRIWDSLAVDLRIRGIIGKISRDFPDITESHQPIIDALEKGRAREAGLLLRNRNPIPDFTERFAGIWRARRMFNRHFFRPILCPFHAFPARPSISPLTELAVTTTTSSPWRVDAGASQSEMSPEKELARRCLWPVCKPRFERKPCIPIWISRRSLATSIGSSMILLPPISSHLFSTRNTNRPRAY
jgi:DNA-binding GntR family transcriptional regulator